MFAVSMVPALGWLALDIWVRSTLPEWIESGAKLSLLVRLLIFAHNWVIRLLPFAAVAFVVLSPLFAIGFALATDSGQETPESEQKSLAVWWCTALALAVGGALVVTGNNLLIVVATAWASFVSYSIALGSAFRLQRARVRRGSSTVNARWFLGGAGLLLYIPPVGFLVPPILWTLARNDAEHVHA